MQSGCALNKKGGKNVVTSPDAGCTKVHASQDAQPHPLVTLKGRLGHRAAVDGGAPAGGHRTGVSLPLLPYTATVSLNRLRTWLSKSSVDMRCADSRRRGPNDHGFGTVLAASWPILENPEGPSASRCGACGGLCELPCRPRALRLVFFPSYIDHVRTCASTAPKATYL